MKKSIKQFTWILLILVSILLLPYIVIGEYWGMVWFPATMPFSIIFEKLIGIGSTNYLLILLVTIMQASWVSTISVLIFNKFKSIKAN